LIAGLAEASLVSERQRSKSRRDRRRKPKGERPDEVRLAEKFSYGMLKSLSSTNLKPRSLLSIGSDYRRGEGGPWGYSKIIEEVEGLYAITHITPKLGSFLLTAIPITGF